MNWVQKYIDWDKLKHEWHSFALQVGGLFVALHEAACEAGADWTPFIPEKYRPYAVPVYLTVMLTVRKYRNPR